MADQENQSKSHAYETSTQTSDVEVQDRGIFDFGKKKKEETPHGEAIVTQFDEKVKISEHESRVEEKKEDEGQKKHSLLDKLHRSGSSSSSSSDEEEEGEGGEKKKKKKEKKVLKEKIHKEEVKHEDTAVPVEKVEADPAHPEEKKGFLNKIKEKLPGQHKKTEDAPPSPPPPSSEYDAIHESSTVSYEGETKEKKGFLEKIKEKLPGYHPKTEEEKEKEKEGASH